MFFVMHSQLWPEETQERLRKQSLLYSQVSERGSLHAMQGQGKH